MGITEFRFVFSNHPAALTWNPASKEDATSCWRSLSSCCEIAIRNLARASVLSAGVACRDQRKPAATIFSVLYSAALLPGAYVDPGYKSKRLLRHLLTLPGKFNVATFFIDRNVAEGKGQRIAIECGDEQVSYQQLLERTNRAGNALRRLGVRAEERVLLVLEDCPEFLYCFFGAIKIGAIAVPASTLSKPREYQYILNDSRARVAVAGENILRQFQSIPREGLRHLRQVVNVGREGPEPFLNEVMDAASPELEAECTSKDDVAFWLYSSGSTGVPKACIMTWSYVRNCTPSERTRPLLQCRTTVFCLRFGAQLPRRSMPISNAIGPRCSSPCRQTTPLCWCIRP